MTRTWGLEEPHCWVPRIKYTSAGEDSGRPSSDRATGGRGSLLRTNCLYTGRTVVAMPRCWRGASRRASLREHRNAQRQCIFAAQRGTSARLPATLSRWLQ